MLKLWVETHKSLCHTGEAEAGGPLFQDWDPAPSWNKAKTKDHVIREER